MKNIGNKKKSFPYNKKIATIVTKILIVSKIFLQNVKNQTGFFWWGGGGK
jgi:hypothetical protein